MGQAETRRACIHRCRNKIQKEDGTGRSGSLGPWGAEISQGRAQRVAWSMGRWGGSGQGCVGRAEVCGDCYASIGANMNSQRGRSRVQRVAGSLGRWVGLGQGCTGRVEACGVC